MPTTIEPTMTIQQIIATLRLIIKDWNYWGQSESDSPLKIGRTKSTIDPLKIDAKLRKKAELPVPELRTVTTKTLDETFNPLIESSYQELKTVFESITDQNYVQIQDLAEPLEYYVQLKNAFLQLTDVSVNYVDAENDSSVGLIIQGKSGTETVYATALLTQT